MSTKQILIVIAAFFVGGVLGFIINGQLCSYRLQELAMFQMMDNNEYQDQNNDNTKSIYRSSGAMQRQGEKMMSELVSELDLTKEQQVSIETLVRKNIENKGFSAMKSNNVNELLNQIKGELTDEQKKEFDGFVAERMPPHLKLK